MKQIKKVGNISNPNSQCGTVISTDGIYPTISAGCHGYANPHILEESKNYIIYDDYNSNIPKNQDYIGTLTTNIGSSTMRNGIKIIEKELNLKQKLCNHLIENELVKENDVIKHSYSSSRMNAWSERNVENNNISPTLDTRCDCLGVVTKPSENLRIRKLTPKECFRLMGFKDYEFEKAEKLNSNSQLYKQAGNSIVVDVLEELLCMIFDDKGRIWV